MSAPSSTTTLTFSTPTHVAGTAAVGWLKQLTRKYATDVSGVLAWAQTPGLACPQWTPQRRSSPGSSSESTRSAATADASMHLRDHHHPRCWLPC
jgi:hypothetical protein